MAGRSKPKAEARFYGPASPQHGTAPRTGHAAGAKRKLGRRKKGSTEPTVVEMLCQNQSTLMTMFATGASWRQVAARFQVDQTQIRQFLMSDEKIMDAYRTAKAASAHFLLDEVQEMAADMMAECEIKKVPNPVTGKMEDVHPDYERVKSVAAMGRTVLAARIAAIEKLNPKEYGALVKIGGDDKNPFQVVVTDYAAARALTGPEERVMKDITPKDG